MPRWIPQLTLAAFLSGCGLSIPNGVFSCVSATDCPSGYSCWNSDGLCYDSKEPVTGCEPSSCEAVIAQFAALDVSIECGTLPDGCDGVVDCPPCAEGEVCGANGQSFSCGCEPSACSTFGAECGTVPVGCGSDERLDCGACPGELACESNRCVCPEGQDCGRDCGGCGDGEICIEGECCMPSFPCAENECSPPGGLPDGCGGFVQCPACGADETCEPSASSSSLVFECLGSCTCEAEGIECGTAAICAASQFCGACEDPNAPLCEDGRCVREDRYEGNESPSAAAPIDCGSSCGLKSLHVQLEATLDSSGDQDFYRIDLAHHEEYAVRVDLEGLKSTPQILITYICPDGSERIDDCSGSSSSYGSSDYCVEDGGDTVRLVQDCGDSGGTATIIVAVSAKQGEFSGGSDTYSLTVSSYPYDD